MKKNVLVFPCGSEIGLEVYRSIYASTHFTVYGGSSADDHGQFIYKNYIGGLPFVNDPDFTDKINGVVSKHDIDIIIPAHDDVLLKLARESDKGNLKCGVLTSPLKTCEITRSKSKTYEHFKNVLPAPRVFKDLADIKEGDWPVFLKPDIGQGSKGTNLAKNLEEARFYTKKDPSLLVLEYLPGKEYTVDCFTNKEGQLLFCEGRERIRVLNGISVDSRTVIDMRFQKLAEKINSSLKLQGPWFFQLKENKHGELALMEIAPRIAGTMGLVRCKGVNLVLLGLYDFFGLDTTVFENDYDMVIDRALENSYKHNIKYSHVYLDFDDLVILDSKVNPTVMAFVYQCVNKNIKVHLLTRHKEDLDFNLKKYRLDRVFDEVIWLKSDEPKYEYIKENDAIFIDDSFAERKQVHEALKMPVFDSHMLEGLMEKF